jgi:hypothetical protein
MDGRRTRTIASHRTRPTGRLVHAPPSTSGAALATVVTMVAVVAMVAAMTMMVALPGQAGKPQVADQPPFASGPLLRDPLVPDRPGDEYPGHRDHEGYRDPPDRDRGDDGHGHEASPER